MSRFLAGAAAAALFAGPALAQSQTQQTASPAGEAYQPDSHMSEVVENAEKVATASFQFKDGEGQGGAVLVETPNGVLLTATIEGLEPGWHGFHIHETGACDPSFQAAGGHYAPGEEGHGFAVEGGAHAGDMPNIHVDDQGVARVEQFIKDVTLTESETTLFDQDGSALMVHAQPDTYLDSASAGDRVACAVIQEAQAGGASN